MRDFAAIWRAAEKVVYSTSLGEPGSARTRIESRFDPAEVRRMKESADRDLSIGGPTLAAAAFAAGLLEEIHLFVVPAIVGGGTRAFPDGARSDLELLAQRRFDAGAVHLHYRVGRR
jgi:dihydrofolate reductase